MPDESASGAGTWLPGGGSPEVDQCQEAAEGSVPVADSE